jgi:cytochrome c-type biogenesis protein CcmF
VKASLGILGVALGASAAGLGIVTLARGLWSHDDHLLIVGRRFLFAVLVAAAVAAGAMEWALLTHDFSLRYVAENNARATPLLFTVTGLWAALEGSILLWTLVLGGYLAYMAHRFRARATDPVVAWANLVGLVVALFFFALMLGPASPFRTLSSAPADGRGPNALLQDHPLMAFHPPLLYLGLVGFTVPFAFAAAALITGRFGEGWLEDTRRSTLFAWGCLGVGIILGAWWSYEVLGWGGFWAWDPVENAALLPWLTATAFLHSVIVQERRGMLRVWNLSLVLATFCLTILATFLTRSGVLNSVHSFTESGIGPCCSCSWRSSLPSASASSPGAETGCAHPGASTPPCPESRRSWSTTCSSPGSPSSSSSAPCTRCWPRRCRAASSRSGSRTSTG